MGGFSIVYLAYDEDGTPVAIKEYLPNSLALRAEGQVTPAIVDEHLGAFRHGMKCFFEEGRALAHLNHPNVVRVLNFFRANETVYMVMQYERGRTLQEHIHKHRGEIRETFVRNVFARLLNGLHEVHTQKLLHLDIKPSTIYLRTDGNPVLLDFGAARQALRTDGPALKPMYTPGFAAPEQYKAPDQMGPWTDIYAVGASMYACLGDKYSKQLLQVIDWCMVLDSAERPASVFTLQRALAEHHHVVHQPSWLDNIGQSLKIFLRK